MYVFNIIVILIEALYFYIPIIKIKKYKRKRIWVYLVLIIAERLSYFIFKDSVFRYLFYFSFIYLSIFAFEKDKQNKNKLFDFFIVPILFFIKAIIEYITYLIFFKYVNYISFVLILETLCILFVLLLKRKFLNIYLKIKENWNSNKEFYCRFLFLIIFNSFILFLIFNLIKIKEVL